MKLTVPQDGGRNVPQARRGSGGGGFLGKLGAMVTGAYSNALRNQQQLDLEYQRQIIQTAGHATRKNVDFEHQSKVLNDLHRRRRSGEDIEQAFGVRFKTSANQPNPNSARNRPKTGRAPSYADTVEAVQGGHIKPAEAASLNQKYSRLHGEQMPPKPTPKKTKTPKVKTGRAPNYEDTLEAVQSGNIKPAEAAELNKKYSRLHGNKKPASPAKPKKPRQSSGPKPPKPPKPAGM